MPRFSHERGIIISGRLEEIIKAESLILEKIKNRRPKDRIEQVSSDNSIDVFRFTIKSSLSGRLIGKGGEFIKHIHDVTGAWVKVAHEQESAPGSADRCGLLFCD